MIRICILLLLVVLLRMLNTADESADTGIGSRLRATSEAKYRMSPRDLFTAISSLSLL